MDPIKGSEEETEMCGIEASLGSSVESFIRHEAVCR